MGIVLMTLAFFGAGLAGFRAGFAKKVGAVLHLGGAAVAFVAALLAERRTRFHAGHVAAGVCASLTVRSASLAGFDDVLMVVHSFVYSAMIA